MEGVFSKKIVRLFIPKENDWKNSSRKMVIKRELSGMQEEFRKQMGTLITSALAFVAALFWRDSLVEVFNDIFPPGQQVFAKFATAMIVSVIAVLAIVFISRML